MKARLLVLLVVSGLLVPAIISYACIPPPNQPPAAHLTVVPEKVTVDVNVVFDARGSYDSDGYITKYEWDWEANGTYDYNETPGDAVAICPYTSIDLYTIGLRVTDDDGATGTYTCKVYVGEIFNITQETAYDTIQGAINDANDGDLIRVYPGIYNAIDFNDRKITVESSNPTDWDTVGATIIDANGSGNAVTFDQSEDGNSVLQGFTVTGGGTGIYCDGTSPTIRNCVIMDNNSSDNGGGVYCNGASPSITNVVMTGNNTRGNSGGGGVYCNNCSSSLKLVNCVFSKNSSAGGGGGVYNNNSSPTLTNCTFSGNSAGGYGGGIYNYSSSPTVANCILWGDAGSGGEIYNDSNSSNPTVSYSCIDGGYTGTGNIDSDPNFAEPDDPEGPDGIFGSSDDGLYIMHNSPCIDAANGDATDFEPSDITDQSRHDMPFADGNGVGDPNYADMGAYESRMVWYVKKGSQGGDGRSWGTAFGELWEALSEPNLATDHEIWVSKGTYLPTDGNDATIAFSLTDGVRLYGGFSGTETTRWQRNWQANQTILSGDIGTPGVNSDNSYNVVTMSERTRIEGFIIEKGNDTQGYSTGGGIYYYAQSGVSVVKNCVIRDNYADYGGGLDVESSAPLEIEGCYFIHNEGYYGGALSEWGSGSSVINCVFSDNSSSLGGAIYNDDYYGEGTLSLINCTLVNNLANNGGGGLYLDNYYGPAIANVDNCIFWGNTDNDGVNADESAQIKSSTCPVVKHSCVQGWTGSWGGEGNIGGEQIGHKPKFTDKHSPAGKDAIFGTADDGLSLHTDSPCVDKGSDMWVPVAATSDVTGAPRITDGDHTTTSPDTDEATVDMGAYELATTWYVDRNVSGGNNDGTSWTDAYDDLQDALSDANILGGDEIWVAEGTYKPTTDPNRDISFVLVPGVAVYGGFDATETTRRQRNWAENETILSGDIDGNDVTDVPDSNNSYHVVKGADGAVLDGFEIIGGNADGSGADSSGGGIYCDDAPMRINHCTIVYNWASSYGGGMYNNGSSSKVTNCLFSGNRAGNDGGGIYNKGGSDAKLINCTITGNKASGNGGGVYSYQSSPTLTNCVVWNNMDGGGIDEPAQISGSVESVTYSCIQDTNPDDANIPFGGSANDNIDDDPCFVDGGYWDWRAVDGADFWTDQNIPIDLNKVAIYDFATTHSDFGQGYGHVPEYDGHPTNDGFVKSYLEIDDACDIDGHPAHKGPSKTTSAEKKMELWFDGDSDNKKKVPPWGSVEVPDWKCIDDINGVFKFNYSEEEFFPLDDCHDPNCHDWDPNTDGHNYYFTFQFRTQSTYIPGQTLRFKASDDLFVYIDANLIINRGGYWEDCPSDSILELVDGNAVVYDLYLNEPNDPPAATIPLGLSEGDTFEFDVFFANRDPNMSVFVMEAPWRMEKHFVVGDYHLESDSNCIDAGDDGAVLPGGGTDLGVYPRFLGTQSIVDMGAYEYGVNQQPADVNAGDYPTITVADGEIYLGNAYFTDDGLPVPPADVTITWECTSQPNDANATFDDSNELNTYVRGLTRSGDYTLQLTVDDGNLYGTDTTTITVKNYAPQVEAGNYGAITVAQGYVYLGGAYVTDDTLPIPPNSLTTLWECIGYPNDANVTFDNANSVNTTVRGLTVSETYTLKLTANDGELDANDTATITVQNYAPQVEAGADKAITLPYETEVHLSDAYVTDNTLPIPPNSLTINWSCANCPGSVTFDNPNEPNTWVRDFNVPGTYTLRLEADDGELSASDNVNIVVNQELIVEAGSDKTINLPVHKATLYGAYITGAPSNVDVTWLAVSCSVGANINAVEFDNNSPEPNNVVTGVTLPEVVADYVLQLSVDNGQTVETDVVKITIGEGPGSDNHDPPQVEAGDYNAITLPEVLHLNDAWVTDDGKPYSMITTQWSTVRGTAGGVVTFDDCKSVNTTAEFSMAGTYTLMLQASDGEKDANDLTVITVNPDPNKNDPPEVYAGSDHSADLEVGGLVVDFDTDLTKEPNVSDDGLPNPPGTVTTQWSVPVGDITAVSFSDITAVKPVVTFTKTGTYVLQLEADDGEFSVIDEMEVTVNLPSGYDAPEVNATFSGERECDCSGGCHEEGEITLPEIVYLYGDINQGTYTATTRWLMVTGPSPVTFGDVSDVNTTAKFSRPGVYVLQLRADDGMAPVSDEVTVTVKSPNRLGGGEAHTVIIDKKKKVWSCGPNRIHSAEGGPGILGTGSKSDALEEHFLTQVSGPAGEGYLENIEAIAAGAIHSLALDSDRNVWSWGDNSYGELGIGVAHYVPYYETIYNRDYNPTPIQVRTCDLIYDPCLIPDANGLHSRFTRDYEDVDAVHVLDNGNIILSSELDNAQIGGLTFNSVDLVEYDPVNDVATKFVDGNDREITSNIDAAYVCDDPNFVIFSTSGMFSVGGTSYYRDDLVKLNRNTNDFSKFFDGDAYDFHRNIDAVHVRDNNNIILSVTGEAALGGIGFMENALIEFNPDTSSTVDGLEPNTARLYFAQAVSMTGYGIDAAFITDANDIIFSTDYDDKIGELSFEKGDLVKCAVDIGYLEDVLDISAGRSGRHSLAVKSDGSVWAWGMNIAGQIGIDKAEAGGDEDVFVPVQVFGLDVNVNWIHDSDEGYLKNIVAVAGGEMHSMALEKLDDANDNCNGRVYTWGAGGQGELGSGYLNYWEIPTMVVAPDFNKNWSPDDGNLVNIVAISAGWDTSMALEKLDPCDPNCNGRIYTWGTIICPNSLFGLLGDGKSDTSSFPIIVHAGEQDPNHPDDANYPLKNIVAISAGESHFMVLDVNGQVWTWGFNGWHDSDYGWCYHNVGGQLGNGKWDDSPTPVKVVAPDRDGDGSPDDLNGDGDPNNDYLGDDIPIVAISAGYWHCLAEDEMGTIYSWGYGDYGRLGIGSEDSYNIPQVVVMGARVHNLDKDRWYNQIQLAIDDADNGDTLVAYPGTYSENIKIEGKTLTLTGTDPNDWNVVANTIIDGGYISNAVRLTNGGNVTMTGFTITHGTRGIDCGSSSPVIKNNIFKDNGEAGIWCSSGATPTIINNWITGNGFRVGPLGISGLIVSGELGTLIRNNTIVHNRRYGVETSGGYNEDLINCIVWKNGEEDNVVGNYNDVNYCAIGGGYAGGTDNFDPCDPCFVNAYDFVDITINNGATTTIEVADASKYEVNDVIEIGPDDVARRVTDVNESTDIITFEPNLTSTSAYKTLIHNWGVGATNIYEDWHIKAESVCRNKGNPSGNYTGEVDIDGEPRELLGRVDVGADEYAPLTVDAGADKEVIIGQKLYLTDADVTDDPCDTTGTVTVVTVVWWSDPNTGVTFSPNDVVDTNVTFDQVGIYTVHLDGYKDYSDGNGAQLAGGDTLTVTVNPWAGENKTIYWPDNHADLNDANATGADSWEWVQVWGTADVEFVNDTNAFDLHPEVNFPDVGIYGLELLAKDSQGYVIGSDTVWISVLMQMIYVDPGSYPAITLSADGTATLKLAGTVSGAIPFYTYWIGPESAVFDDPCDLDTDVTFTTAEVHPLELRAYDQSNQKIGAAVTWITVYGASVVDAGEYGPITWPANSVTLDGRIVSGDPDWTEWTADADYVSFDDPCKLDAQATFSEPAVYQLRLTAYDMGVPIGEDDVWITVNPVDVNASLNAGTNVDDGQIIFPNKADLYALSPTPGTLPDGVTMEWDEMSGYVTINQSSGWEHATAQFDYPGSYYITLVAKKNDKVLAWDTLHITVGQPSGVVDAGPDKVISLSQSPLQLTGTIVGTELPDVNYLWSLSSYEGPDPCGVTFAPNDSNDANVTQARFYTTGVYGLLFRVYTGENLLGWDTVKITVNNDNQPPIVKAGHRKMGVVNSPIKLYDAMVWDENDIGDLTLLWEVDSSPSGSSVIFDPNYTEPNDSNQLDPNVTFDAVGPYALKLTATDPCNNSGTGYLEVLIGTATQQTVISAGKDKTIILPQYSVHLADAWVFPALTDDMTVQWTAPNVPDGGYVGFIDLADVNEDPCDSISILRPLVTFSQNKDANEVVTGDYVLELTLSIPNEPNDLTDQVTITVANSDTTDPIITTFYATIDGNSIDNDSNLEGLIDILVVVEDEDLNDVTLELDQTRIINPDNTEVLEGVPGSIQKMRLTYSIHTSQIATTAGYHSLTVTVTDMADNNDTEQIDFHIKEASIIEPIARISGWEDEGASQTYGFAEEPEPTTVIDKGLFKLIGAACLPPDSFGSVEYKIDLFKAKIGDAPVEYWNPSYQIYHECFVKNLTGDGFLSGPIGSDSNDNVLAGPDPNLDLTGVENGSYQLLLTVKSAGVESYAHVGFVLDTQLKVGNVKFTQEDLIIPVGGIALRVTRTYDSLNRDVDGDFGYGWSYSIANMDIELNENRMTLESFTEWGEYTSVRFDSNYNRNVTLTLPNGQRATFIFYLKSVPSQGNPYAPNNYQAMYASPPGVTAKLRTKEETEIMDAFGFWSSVWGTTGAIAYQDNYDFSGFVLTTEDGTTYHIERKKYASGDGYDIFWYHGQMLTAKPYGPPYLDYIETASGEEIDFNVNKTTLRIGDIEHKDKNNNVTKTIQIEYERGNIVEIRAPSEQGEDWPTLQYDYDSSGNLTAVHRLIDGTTAGLDFDGRYQTITYDYNDPCGVFGPGEHYVFDIEDERGISPIMYYYDDDGLLEAVRDARGNRIELSHDLGAKKETVTDRSGNLKIYYYDDRGNVLRESAIVDANERILTEYEYDYQPSGKPGESNYDAGNPDKPSAVKMPLVDSPDPCDSNDWSITRYEYDGKGRTTLTTDPKWNVMENKYDGNGNLELTIQARPSDPCASNPVYPNDYIEVSRTKNYYTSDLLTKTELIDPNGTSTDTDDVVFEQTEYFYDNKNRLTDVNKVDPNDLSEINVTHYTYDDGGNFPSSPNSVKDAAGSITNFDYDKNGNQVKSWYDWVDPNDAVRSCTVTKITEYDDAGRVTQTLREVSNASGGIDEYTIVLSETIYNSIGKPDTVYDQYDNATVYSYDELGNLVETLVYDPCGTLLTVSETLYDKEGRVLVSVDAHDPNEAADGTENVYDELGRVIETCRWSDVDVNLVDLVVDGNVVGRKLADDAEPNNAWEGSGDPPAGLNFGWTVDDGNLPVVGNELSYGITEYDLLGRVKMSISLDEDGYEWPTSYKYDAAGKQIAVYDPCGHDITRDVDGKTIVTAEPNDSLGYRTETQYLGTRRWKVTDARGFETGADPNDYTTEFVYDALGRVVTTIHPPTEFEGSSEAEPTYTHTAYDYFGRRLWQSEQTTYANGNDPNILGREFRYDDAGRLTNTVLPDVNDPCNNDTPTYPRYDYYYDDYGNLTAIQDYIKEYYDYTVDSNYARETKFTYNPLHKQLTRRLPDGKTEYKYYDEFGRIIKVVDFKGQVTGFEYNVRGLLEFKKFYANDTLYTSDDPNMLYEYTYDNLGRKLSVEVNDLDAVTVDTYQYDYDAEGRVVEVNTPQGVVYYDYNDITGRKDSTWTDETEVEYEYDELGRLKLTKTVKRDGTTLGTAEETTYTYNEVGSRNDTTLPNGVTTDYQYDALNRLTSITYANSVSDIVASYTYYLTADGMRTQLAEIVEQPGAADTEDNIIDYTYDNLNRITQEYADANGTSDYYQIDYVYGVVGNRLSRTIEVSNSTVGTQTLTTTYTYDPNNDQLLKEVHNGPFWVMLINDQPVYAYSDNYGGIIYKGAEGSIGKFKAFMLGLPNEWSWYAFMAVLVLVPLTFLLPWFIDLRSRIRRAKPRHSNIRLSLFHRCLSVLLAYIMLLTPCGLQSVAEGSILYSQLDTRHWAEGDRKIEYAYDANGSLIEKKTWDTAPEPDTLLETVTYDYNLQNRLVSVSDGTTTVTYKYNPDGIRVQADDGTTVTDYLIDAYNHTGYAQVLEEWSGGTHPDITYTIGDDVITQYNSTDGTECLLYDGHGSTRQLVDSSEDITDAYSYDAYGVMLGGNPTSSPATSLLYAGEQFDVDAQQYYLRARYYDPLNGRFNRMDPFSGNNQDPQSLHKYLYAHCNPVNNIDPSGMMTLAGVLVRVGLAAIMASILLPAIHGAYTRAKSVAARMNQSSVFSAIFKGAFTWNDWKQVILGFSSGADAGIINALDTLTFRLVDPLHEYRDNLWQQEGLEESWVGSAANVFAWAGTASLYTAAAVWTWSAAGRGTMDIAVKYTGEPRAWFHFQYGVNGTWQHAWGRVGQMPIRHLLASKVEGTLLTGIPVLHPQAVMGSGYAYNCLVAALKALGRGWGL